VTTFEKFAAAVVARHDDHLCNEGPDEQAERVVKAMDRLHRIAPLAPAINTDIDLAGFGKVPALYTSANDTYMLLSDITDQLGWFQPKAHKWADREHGFAVEDQRRADEERGDGRLGWGYMHDYIDLGLDLVVDDPEAKPDRGGRSWSTSGDWLISHDRLPLLLSSSPWGKEFMDNTMPAFGYAMRQVWGDKLKDVPTYGADGTPTGGNAFTDMFRTDGLTEEEALRRARRGPSLDT
jgi:hypothetical protein